jgi:hypothetical protein
MLLATAVATHAEDATLLRALPSEVQGEIIRALSATGRVAEAASY